MRIEPTTTDLLATLAEEQRNEPTGTRNVSLFRRSRVALEAGYEPDAVAAAMREAGEIGGLSDQEIDATLASALKAERADRPAEGVPPLEPEHWERIWARGPRVIGIDVNKVPVQRWQYDWGDPHDPTRPAKYLAVVLPPGVAVVDIDDYATFSKEGLAIPGDAPAYSSISGNPNKMHVWFRLHPDRPYPKRQMDAWPGADLLVGGYGVANMTAETLATLPPPDDLPLAPDWLQPRASRGRILNIKDYIANVPEHIPWVIGEVAYLHGLTLISGPPKAGKSTLAFSLMAARETGIPFCGVPVVTGPTLLVTEEGGVSIRFKAAGLANLDVYDRAASEGEDLDKTLAVIAEWCTLNPEGLVVIDTLAAWAGLEDENDSASTQAAIDSIRLKVTAAFDVAVILVHHSRKGGGPHGEAVRGSSAILAAVDTVVELKRVDDKHPTRRYIDLMGRVLPQEVRWLVDWNPLSRSYDRLEDDFGAEDGDLEDDVAGIPSDGPGVNAKETGLTYRRLSHLVNIGRVRRRDGAGRLPHLYWGIPPVGLRVEHDAVDEDWDDDNSFAP